MLVLIVLLKHVLRICLFTLFALFYFLCSAAAPSNTTPLIFRGSRDVGLPLFFILELLYLTLLQVPFPQDGTNCSARPELGERFNPPKTGRSILQASKGATPHVHTLLQTSDLWSGSCSLRTIGMLQNREMDREQCGENGTEYFYSGPASASTPLS